MNSSNEPHSSLPPHPEKSHRPHCCRHHVSLLHSSCIPAPDTMYPWARPALHDFRLISIRPARNEWTSYLPCPLTSLPCPCVDTLQGRSPDELEPEGEKTITVPAIATQTSNYPLSCTGMLLGPSSLNLLLLLSCSSSLSRGAATRIVGYWSTICCQYTSFALIGNDALWTLGLLQWIFNWKIFINFMIFFPAIPF